MLNDTRPRCLTICVVHCCIALKIRLVKQFIFKANRAILKCTQFIIKVSINRTGIDNFICQRIQLRLLFKIICVQTHFNPLQQAFYHLCVAAYRDSLVKCIKVVIVKCQTHRQTFDNKCRELFAVTPPLLLRIPFNQFFIDITSNQ